MSTTHDTPIAQPSLEAAARNSAATAPRPIDRPAPVSRFNAWFFDNVDGYLNLITRTHKSTAFSNIAPGSILEIGAGTGANFSYLPAGASYTALEPSHAMHARLIRRAERNGIDLQLLAVPAESIPLADNSIDTVMLSLVLCTVRDPEAVLAEILRVLRPGGTMRFVEHVAAPSVWSPRRWLQRLITRPWTWLFEGCQLRRDTASAIGAAGFSDVQLHHRRLHRSVFTPINRAIHGIATK